MMEDGYSPEFLAAVLVDVNHEMIEMLLCQYGQQPLCDILRAVANMIEASDIPAGRMH